MKSDDQSKVDGRLTLALVAWVCLVMGGSAALIHYSASPGEFAAAPTAWPRTTALGHRDKREHLLLFLHPKCPCSRATLRQLLVALTHSGGGLRVQAVVFAPSGEPAEWTQTALVRDTAAMPGVEVVLDADGREAERFGVRTSGHLLLYDTKDRLVFSGGITPGRGHEGSCAGLEGLIARLRGQEAGADRAMVFGCPITTGDVPCTNCGASHAGTHP